MNEEALNKAEADIKRIQGVREYLWPDSEILFVQNRLPLIDSLTPLFGSAARKVWWALHEAGLVTRLFDNPMEAEETVFGAGRCIAGDHRWSIMTLSWDTGMLLLGRRARIESWERVEKVCAAAKAKKLAYLGKEVATKGGRDWSQFGIPPTNPMGFLRDHLEYGHSARLYGLPLTNIGPESLRYFSELL